MGVNEPFNVQPVTKSPIHRHTPVCWQRTPEASVSSQADTFVCLDDAQWQTVETAYHAVQQAHTAWMAALGEVGTYRAALERGTYHATSAEVNLDSGMVQRGMETLADITADDYEQDQAIV